MKLFGGTVPPPKHLFGGTVPPAKKLFGGTIPPNNFFGGGTPYNSALRVAVRFATIRFSIVTPLYCFRRKQ